MRRPASDVRQRESGRRSSLENNGSRRRNSSVPFHNGRIHGMNPNSMDSDTDFLCDRAVEFMESGDIHSIVAVELAEQSMYFERLLRYHHGRGNIRLPEFLNPGFPSVLEYIRKGTTEINRENVYHIFIAADFLLVPKLKQECANLLKEIASDSSTAISLWLTCRSLYWPEVGMMAFQKILENFENVWQSTDFQNLDAVDVREILHEDGLNCKREKNVFDAIMRWVSENFKTRIHYTLELLLCIRIGMLSTAELDYIKNHDLVRVIPEYFDILNQWPNCLTLTSNPIIAAYGQRFITPRLPHEVVMVFGGWCDGEGPRAAAQVYNPKANTWTLWTEAGQQAQPLANEWLSLLQGSMTMTTAAATMTTPTTTTPAAIADTSEITRLQNAVNTVNTINQIRSTLPSDGMMTSEEQKENLLLFPHNSLITENSGSLIGEIPRRVYAGCVLIDKRVYLVGGFDGSSALKSTLCYDFEIDSGWYEISCMYEKRYYVSVAYADNHIYALGGHNGENQGRLDSAERYTLHENLWQTIASMNRVRSDAAAAELGGKVYVAGGFEGRRYHDSAEYYDPQTNQWTLVSRMNSPRGGISLAQHNSYLYAIGGNDGNSRLRTIERYDPIESRWEIVGQMNRRKSNLSSTVVNDEIYILGGWSDEPEAGILDLVECFDTVSRECRVVRPLTFPASATCACTLKDRNLVKKYIRPLPIPSTHFSGQPIPSDQNLPVNTTAPTFHENNYGTTNFFTGQRNTNNRQVNQANKVAHNCSLMQQQVMTVDTTATTTMMACCSHLRNDNDPIYPEQSTSNQTAAATGGGDDNRMRMNENQNELLLMPTTSSMIVIHGDININDSNNNSNNLTHNNNTGQNRTVQQRRQQQQQDNSISLPTNSQRTQSPWRKPTRRNCKRKSTK
uniref:BACK domain-containing protein n=1 Tax=Trichobilharzia regenti TaxID=157069 RepID=A0AA85IR05_TRIRE|nr:unnamed protein product [Trichobilharzia regenti]